MITMEPLLVRLAHLREHIDEWKCGCDESVGWVCQRCYFSGAVSDAIRTIQDYDREDEVREDMRKNPPSMSAIRRNKNDKE